MVFRKKDEIKETVELTEAKVDKDKMKAWGGEELFNRFMELKNRLESPLNDMTYWTSSKNPHEPSELVVILDKLESDTKAKKERDRAVRDGAEKVYEDDEWLVYHITTFEASQRYGAGSRWCITGKNLSGNDAYGNHYWNSYTGRGIQFYFFIKKSDQDKWALALEPNGSYSIFNAADDEVYAIPNAPQVDGLPNVSIEKEDPDYDDDDLELPDDEMDLDDEDEVRVAGADTPIARPNYETEPVAVPPVFPGATPEDAAESYASRIVSEVIPGRLFIIELPEGKFTLFAFERGFGGPLAAQTSNGFAIIKFDTEEGANQMAQQFVTGGTQIQTSDTEETQTFDGEEVDEAFSFKLREDVEDYRVDVEVKPLSPNDEEYVRDAIRNRSEHFDWYVLHYDTETTDYLNDIEFSNLKDAWEKFKGEEPMSKSDRVELIFAPEFSDDEFEDNVVVTYKK